MIRLFELLWHGCWHKWELTGQGNLTFNEEYVGNYFYYKCSKCNRVKCIDVT